MLQSKKSSFPNGSKGSRLTGICYFREAHIQAEIYLVLPYGQQKDGA